MPLTLLQLFFFFFAKLLYPNVSFFNSSGIGRYASAMDSTRFYLYDPGFQIYWACYYLCDFFFLQWSNKLFIFDQTSLFLKIIEPKVITTSEINFHSSLYFTSTLVFYHIFSQSLHQSSKTKEEIQMNICLFFLYHPSFLYHVATHVSFSYQGL